MLSYPPFSPMTVSADTVAEGVVRSGPPEAQDRVAPEENGRSGSDGTKRADVVRKIIDAAPGCEDDRLLFPGCMVPRPIVGRPREDRMIRADERRMREKGGAEAVRRN